MSNALSNFRPINTTSVISRIMEKVVSSAITNYTLSNNLINRAQHGFLKSRSTVTCQLDFLNHITYLKDKSLQIMVIYFDLCKAFDKVPHQRLIQKLTNIGLQHPLLTWINSFLQDRYQCVKVDEVISKPRKVESGVIQGSVLGPLLFNLYINDLTDMIQYGKSFLFADDLKIVYASKRLETKFTENIQDDLQRLENWSTKWLMPFSPHKCGIITTLSSPLPPIYFFNHPISTKECIKDLGLMYSSTVNFSEHIDAITNKARRLMGFILRNFSVLEARTLLYTICIRPVLEYNPAIYCLIRSQDRIKIESIQRSYTRWIVTDGSSSRPSYETRCHLLHLEPLWLRRLKLNLIFIYKLLHCLSYSENNPLELVPSSNYELRDNDMKIVVPRYKTRIRANFITIKYANIWNRLPRQIRTISNLNTFKQNLNKYLEMPGLLHLLGLDRCYTVDLTKGPPNI